MLWVFLDAWFCYFVANGLRLVGGFVCIVWFAYTLYIGDGCCDCAL